MKNLIKDAAILLIITLFSGLILGFVFQITKEPIALAEEKAAREAYSEVFPCALSFEPEENAQTQILAQDALWVEGGFDGVSIDHVLRALDKDGTLLGYVLTVTSHEGYGGDITFTMGIANDGTLNGISILDISETAGLGMKAEEVLKPQFAEKNVPVFTDRTTEISPTSAGETADARAGFWGVKPQTGIVRGCPLEDTLYFPVLSRVSGKKPGKPKEFLVLSVFLQISLVSSGLF